MPPLPEQPRRLTNVVRTAADAESAGVAWKLDMPARGLDANVVALRPDQRIDRHVGAEVDVLLQVLAGDGTLGIDGEPIELTVGDLIWLPRRSVRDFAAGSSGLIYLTVHQHRESLVIGPPPPRAQP